MSNSYYPYSEIPFVRLVIPFISGIIFFKSFPFLSSFYTVPILLGLLILLVIVQVNIRISYRQWKNISWGIIINVFLFVLGYALCEWHYPNQKIQDADNDKYLVVGNVIEKPEIKPKSVKLLVEIEAVKTHQGWQRINERSVFYVEKDNRSSTIKMGDQLLFHSLLKVPENLGNPEEFNIRQFLFFHYISYSSYVKSDEWSWLSKTRNSFSIFHFADQCRDYFLSIIRQMKLSDDVFAITSAILLGYKNEIDEDLKKSYAYAGASHILAVSGLHVGVVYLVIQWLLFFLNKNRKLQLLRLFLVLCLLWFYALMTGLSSSVVRATTMFSFVALARFMNRPTNIYNVMAASAFLILLVNPFELFKVGFQLSYVAVIGIVYYQPKIRNWFYIKSKVLSFVWDLISVTIAAQLVTTPLSLYYFHQFPSYFLLSGIVLVPLVTIVIYVALAVIIFSWLPYIGSAFSFLLQWLVTFMNDFTIFVEKLPYAVITNIYVNEWLLLLLYSLIILITAFILTAKIRFLRLSLLVLIVISMSLVVRKYESLSSRAVIIYNLPSASTLNLIDGRDNIVFVSKEHHQKLLKTARENWIKMGMEAEKVLFFENLTEQYLFSNILALNNVNVWFKRHFMSFYNYKIFIINDNTFYGAGDFSKKINVDLLVVQGKAKVSMDKLLTIVNAKWIVFDSSCPKHKLTIWKNQLKNTNISYWDVQEKKAWYKKFDEILN